MTTSIDINLLPIARYGDRDYPELIGLHYAEPMRRSARGRDLDRLLLFLILEGNAPLPPDKRDQLLSDLSKNYYRTSGSVTAALRMTADSLNQLLLERNLQLGASRQCVGHMVQIVLREERLTVADSGLLQVHWISAEGVIRIDDPELAGRGLGISKTGTISFSQGNIEKNDVLLICTKPAPEWTQGFLKSVHGQGPESLRRRLFHQTTGDLHAVAVQAKQGKGKFFLLISSGIKPPPPAEEQPVKTKGSIPVPSPSLPLETSTVDKVVETFAPGTDSDIVHGSSFSQAQASVPPVTHPTNGLLSEKPETKKKNGKGFLMIAFSQAGRWLAEIWQKLAGGTKTLIGRMLPDESFLNIPSSVMAFIAVAVPVAIVTAATMVYFRLGRSAQYTLLSSQAKQMVQQAEEQSDLGEKRSELGAALSTLQKAESFAGDSESRAEITTLRSEVRAALDQLDFVRRLNYQPAINGGLPLTSKIIAMASYEDQLYLLDEESGSVLRAFLTDQGYELDYTFQCTNGVYGEIKVESIVEIIAWPAGYKPQASVLAVDSGGSVLYCEPNTMPIAARITPGEGEGWGNIIEAVLDQGDFFALDLPSNGVWIYWRANIGEQPTMFFDEQIPPLQNVIDMLVDRDDLYLLQQNGSIIMCVRETLVVSPTRCHIQPYTDRRPGRENLPLVPPVPFSQILSMPPPDPSLYLLEPQGQAVYHFSLRNLAFQNVYLAEGQLPSNIASAFTINQERRLFFLALGNQVYYAAMP